MKVGSLSMPYASKDFRSRKPRANRIWGFNVKHIRRLLIFGKCAAWLAAYALVFNVVLTSTLLASISPLDVSARHQLCLNSASVLATTNGNADKPIVRCPLCSLSTIVADLPPLTNQLTIRVALQAPFEISGCAVFFVNQQSADHQTRGPPNI